MAAVITAIGAAIDARSTDGLGSIFNFCYLVGCVIAALAVRRRALFTAAAQPPLIAFLVGVITLYGLNADEASGLKSLIFKVLIPIANDFPWIAFTFVLTLGLVLARWFLTRDRSGSAGGARRRSAGSSTSGRAGATATTSTASAATSRSRSAAKVGATAASGSTATTSAATRSPRSARATSDADAGTVRTELRRPAAAAADTTDRPRRRRRASTPAASTPASSGSASSDSVSSTSVSSTSVSPSTGTAADEPTRPAPRPRPRPAPDVEGITTVPADPPRPPRRQTAGAVARAEGDPTILPATASDDGVPSVRRRPPDVANNPYPSTRSRNRN